MPQDIEVVKTAGGDLRGYGIDNDNAYKRFKAWLKQLEPGECFTFSYRTPRDLVKHRRFMAMLRLGFEHWEPSRGRKRLTYKGRPIEKDFEVFRREMIILAGFYTPKFDAKGRVALEADSISFTKTDQDKADRMYEAVRQVLLEHVLSDRYDGEELDRVVEQLQKF